jgi:hypothetical protein
MENKKNTYKDNQSKLAERILNSPAKIPIQVVGPAINKKPEIPKAVASPAVHVNFWADSALMDEFKILTIRTKKSIKQLANEAFTDLIEKYK